MLDLPQRPRRNRKSPAIRAFHRETWLAPQHFVHPLFVHEGADDVPIASMPGCARLGRDGLMREVAATVAEGVGAVVMFPAVRDALKTSRADEAWNPDGLIPATIRRFKAEWPDLVVVTDVALDPYNSDGHDGIVDADGRVLNDETVEVLCRRRSRRRDAGADVIAPSDMMDGRVGAIRRALDARGLHRRVDPRVHREVRVGVLRPVPRRARFARPRFGDKKTYQMDPANAREALREVALDVAEGADMRDGEAGRAVPRRHPGAPRGDDAAGRRVPGERRVRDAQGRRGPRLARRAARGAGVAWSASGAPAPTSSSPTTRGRRPAGSTKRRAGRAPNAASPSPRGHRRRAPRRRPPR